MFNHFQIQRFAFVLGGKRIINVVINPFITGFTMDICVQQFQYQRYLVSGGRPPALRLTRCHFQASSTETSISSAWQMVQTERFCPHRGFRRRLYLAWKLYPSHLLTKSLHGLGRGQANLYVQTHTATALTRGWLLRLVALCWIQEFGSGKEMVTGWFSFFFYRPQQHTPGVSLCILEWL